MTTPIGYGLVDQSSTSWGRNGPWAPLLTPPCPPPYIRARLVGLMGGGRRRRCSLLARGRLAVRYWCVSRLGCIGELLLPRPCPPTGCHPSESWD